MSPQLPLELLLLITNQVHDLQTLVSLSLTCHVLHAHIALPRVKIFYLVGTELDNATSTLHHLAATCKRLHALLAPLTESHRVIYKGAEWLRQSPGEDPSGEGYRNRAHYLMKTRLWLWMEWEWRRVLYGDKGAEDRSRFEDERQWVDLRRFARESTRRGQ